MYARVLRKWSLNVRTIKCYLCDLAESVTNEILKTTAKTIPKTAKAGSSQKKWKNCSYPKKQMSLMWLVVTLKMLLLFVCIPANAATAAKLVNFGSLTNAKSLQHQKPYVQLPNYLVRTMISTVDFTTTPPNTAKQTTVTATIENAGHTEEESFFIPVSVNRKDNNLNYNANSSNIYSHKLSATLNEPNSSRSSRRIFKSSHLEPYNSRISHSSNSKYKRVNAAQQRTNARFVPLPMQLHTSLAANQLQTIHNAYKDDGTSSNRNLQNSGAVEERKLLRSTEFQKQKNVPNVENSQNPYLLIFSDKNKESIYNNNHNNNIKKDTLLKSGNSSDNIHNININKTNDGKNLIKIIGSTNKSERELHLKMRRHLYKQRGTEAILSERSNSLTNQTHYSSLNLRKPDTPANGAANAVLIETVVPFRYVIESIEVPYNGGMLLQRQQQATRNRRDSHKLGTIQKYLSSLIGNFSDINDKQIAVNTTFPYGRSGSSTNSFRANYFNSELIHKPLLQTQNVNDNSEELNSNNNRFQMFMQQPAVKQINHQYNIMKPGKHQSIQHKHASSHDQFQRKQQNQNVQDQYEQTMRAVEHNLQKQLKSFQHEELTTLQQQERASTPLRRSNHRRYPKQKRKHGHRYCSARDPAQLAFEAPTVFEGKIISMTPDRRSNFSATIEVHEIFKQQIGFTLQKYVRLRFAYRNSSGECDIYREQLRPRGLVRGDELEQGRVYLIFVRQIDLGNFTILGQPIRKTRHVTESVRAAVSENYAQLASIRSITASNRSVESGKELRIICKVQGRPPPKVTWFKDHKSLKRNRKIYQFVHYKKRSELVIRSFNSSDAGRYECRAKNKVNRNLERRAIVIKAYKVPRYDIQTSGGTGNNCPDDASEFCFNGGTCKFFSEIGSFSCICPEGFIGERCDRKEVNSMPPSTYSNEQECGEKKFLGSYYC